MKNSEITFVSGSMEVYYASDLAMISVMRTNCIAHDRAGSEKHTLK